VIIGRNRAGSVSNICGSDEYGVYILPKEDATISGYDSEYSLRHIHCSRHGKIITHPE